MTSASTPPAKQTAAITGPAVAARDVARTVSSWAPPKGKPAPPSAQNDPSMPYSSDQHAVA
jgi:hypothetical protein